MRFPDEGSIYDYFIDPTTKKGEPKKCTHWREIIPVYAHDRAEPYGQIFVPTLDSTRVLFLGEMMMKLKKPVMLVGNAGSAKTVIMNVLLRGLDEDEWMFNSSPAGIQTAVVCTRRAVIDRYSNLCAGSHRVQLVHHLQDDSGHARGAAREEDGHHLRPAGREEAHLLYRRLQHAGARQVRHAVGDRHPASAPRLRRLLRPEDAAHEEARQHAARHGDEPDRGLLLHHRPHAASLLHAGDALPRGG
eukprot:2898021-Prymnesium_polylepis.1